MKPIHFLSRRRFLQTSLQASALASSGVILARQTAVADVRHPGPWASQYGEPSRHEKMIRTVSGNLLHESETPQHRLSGMITPSSLHYERHHAGVPDIDPENHKLLIHGMVERPLTFTLQDLLRFPHRLKATLRG